MTFNKHYDLEGRHAFLGASKYHWVNYDEDKLDAVYKRRLDAERGTQYHLLARDLILLGVKLPKTKNTLNMYVNDAIGYRMTVEQPLYFSENCFGTVDAISFRKNFLRIHDYKSGVTPAKFLQLDIYAALFCLEYSKDPYDIQIEERLYQTDDIQIRIPPPQDIFEVCEKIMSFNKRIEFLKIGE